jgi:hypothetical protein
MKDDIEELLAIPHFSSVYLLHFLMPFLLFNLSLPEARAGTA